MHTTSDSASRAWAARVSAALGRPQWAFALVALLLVMQIQWWWNPGNDAAAYLSIARNLAEGRVESLGRSHLHYAPGYPLLLAPACWLAEEPFVLISLLHLGLALLLAAGVYVWARRLAPRAAAYITLLVTVNASFWEHYRMTHSELAFMAELIWSAYAVCRAAECVSWRSVLAWNALGGALGVLACVTRQAGIAVLGGYVAALAALALRRKIGWFRALAGVVLVVLPALLATAALVQWDKARAANERRPAKAYSDYMIDPQLSLGEQLLEGARLRISEVGRLLLPGMHKTYARTGQWLHVNMPLFALAAAAVVYGWGKLTWQRADPLLCGLPFYTALYIVWPFDQATRYMLPMLPALAASLWRAAAPWFMPRRSLAVIFIAMHLAAAGVYWLRERDSTLLALWRKLSPLAAQVRQHAVGDSVAWELDEPTRLMLSVQMNCRIAKLENAEEVPSATRWVWSTQPRPGFVVRAAVGQVRLLEREHRPPSVASSRSDDAPLAHGDGSSHGPPNPALR